MQTVSTTIFCVVSSSDANRHKLLKEHQENILSQTKPIKAIYVFERDDCPPSGLFGEKINDGISPSVVDSITKSAGTKRSILAGGQIHPINDADTFLTKKANGPVDKAVAKSATSTVKLH